MGQLKQQLHTQAKQRLNSNVQSHMPQIQSSQSRRKTPSTSQHPVNKILPSGLQKVEKWLQKQQQNKMWKNDGDPSSVKKQ